MIRSKSLAPTLALVTCLLAGVAVAQGPGPGPGGAKMDPDRQKQMRQDMMKKMEADDAKLEELVAAMNAAQGQAKVDAIAAVLNEMVSQRRAMRAHRDEMRATHGGMGGGMGGGKGAGKGQGNGMGGGKAPKPAPGAEAPAS